MSLLLLLGAATVAFLLLVPFGPQTETFVDIPSGTGAFATARLLKQHGIIRSQTSFDLLRFAARGRMRAGEYRFDHPASALEVYRRLRRGDVFTLTLVVPEGYSIFDIARAVEAAGLGSAPGFLVAAQTHTELVRQWSPHAASLEGFLFPSTYRFSRHSPPLTMLTTMVRQWQRAAEPLFLVGPIEPYTSVLHTPSASASSTAEATLDWNGIITIASLIEKEVRAPAERPLVAGVFRNRLRRGMPLQTDPAVIYAALLESRYRGTIYASDLASASPYNTYRHTGLPPGPICNPGLASLRAALHPATTDFLYFVSDAAGHTRFAADLKQQTANVASYRKAAQQGTLPSPDQPPAAPEPPPAQNQP